MTAPHLNCHMGVRRTLIRFLLALVGLCCPNVVSAQILDVPGWDLVWNDEFEGDSLNTTNWTALNRRNSFNNELQYYHPNQVTVSGGNLELTAIDVPRQDKAYQSGLVTSKDLFGPGRFEARIDLPTTQGMWPAFWLNSNHVPWPQGGEIDILENRGSQPNVVSSAYHWQTNPGPCCDQHQYVSDEYNAFEGGQPVNFHDSFHTYTAEWDETTIKYYVDGNLHFTVTEHPNRPIFETAKNIILNLAVGGDFGGDPNGTTVFPQTMLVDYVRYWQPDGTPEPEPEPDGNLLNNPGLDDNGGSLNGWNIFGNSTSNVSANSQLSNDGTHALKIFGQFNGSTNFSGASQGVAISEGDSLQAVASTRNPSWDTLFGTNNDVEMRLEFYSDFGAAYGSSDFLGEVSQLVHDGSTAENIWFDHMLEATAPQNAVEARLSFLFQQSGFDTGAIWIDSAGIFVQSMINGDFNNDEIYDCTDIDALVVEIAAGTNAPQFDLTGDGSVNEDDLAAWLVEGGANNPNETGGNPFLPGDANLDGTVDGVDFLVWNSNKFTSNAAWCSADFTADGTVDGADFLVWNSNKFISSDAVNAVPEPGSWLTFLVLSLCGCWRPVRKRQYTSS